MQSGKFDTPISIERYISTRSSLTGSEQKTWSELQMVWSEFVPNDGGTESIQAAQRENKQTAVFTIRFTDVTVFDRVKHNGDYYNIIAIKRVERDMYLRLITELTL